MPAAQRPPARGPCPRRVIPGVEPSAALPLSIALHLVMLYALSHVSFTVPERDPVTSIVWLQDWLPPEQRRTEVPSVEDLQEPENRSPDEPSETETEIALETSEAPLAERARGESTSADPVPEPSPASSPGPDPTTVEETFRPDAEATEDESLPLAVDWEEARRNAIARIREERERGEDFSASSLGDSIEERRASAAEPAAPPAKPWPPCPVVNRLAVQLAMAMVGMCFRTRDARGNLFSHVEPSSSQSRPVCELVTDADGNETYKCRLVPELPVPAPAR